MFKIRFLMKNSASFDSNSISNSNSNSNSPKMFNFRWRLKWSTLKKECFYRLYLYLDLQCWSLIFNVDIDGWFLTFIWAGLYVRMFLPIYSQQMSTGSDLYTALVWDSRLTLSRTSLWRGSTAWAWTCRWCWRCVGSCRALIKRPRRVCMLSVWWCLVDGWSH